MQPRPIGLLPAAVKRLVYSARAFAVALRSPTRHEVARVYETISGAVMPVLSVFIGG